MADNPETVILIHGLWMRGFVLVPLQRRLRQAGFVVRRFSYPSWQNKLADNVRLLQNCIGETPGGVIHLVGHSLGGLVALGALTQQPDPRVQRIVLLGTPFAGCHCADTAAAHPLLAVLAGNSLPEWRSLPRPIAPQAAEIGVIAGTLPVGLGRLVCELERPNDGMVTVGETFISEARDRIVLNVSHTTMLLSRACAEQVAHFLKAGRFSRD